MKMNGRSAINLFGGGGILLAAIPTAVAAAASVPSSLNSRNV